MSPTIAVIGAKGFVGTAICNEIENRAIFDLIRITRSDNAVELIKCADIVIHSANPSKRYFAEMNPKIDFAESVEKTYAIMKLAQGKKIILISTISARTQKYTVYGRNRRSCEMIIDDPNNLIIRLGPMFGEGRPTGPLFDILHDRTVYVSEKTSYAFVDVSYNAKKIIDLIESSGMVEIGARNSIVLGELKEILGSKSDFTGPDDTQIPLNPLDDAPDARDVIAFASSYR